MRIEDLQDHRICFDWDKDSESPEGSFDSMRERASCLNSTGHFKSILGSFKLVPGEVYYWEVKVLYGSHFLIGVARSAPTASVGDDTAFTSQN